MAAGAAQTAWQLAYEENPVTLVGGIAGAPGGTLPLSTLLNGALFAGSTVGIDEAFAKFYPLPGASLIENQLGEYPFASLAIAANSIIKQPLNVSLLMRCPVTPNSGWSNKLSIITGLQNTLANHCAQGGTFIVATPSFWWSDAILVGLHDVSGGETAQAQYALRWDFRKPLISGQQIAGQLNSLMQSLTSGQATDGSGTDFSAATPAAIGSPGVTPSQTSAASTGIPSNSTIPFFASGQ